jgi:hypothetical protein
VVYSHVIDGTAVGIFHAHPRDAIAAAQEREHMPPRIQMLVFVAI